LYIHEICIIYVRTISMQICSTYDISFKSKFCYRFTNLVHVGFILLSHYYLIKNEFHIHMYGLSLKALHLILSLLILYMIYISLNGNFLYYFILVNCMLSACYETIFLFGM